MHGVLRRHLLLLPLLACATQHPQVVPLDPLRGAGVLSMHSLVTMRGGARVPVDGGVFSRDSVVGTHVAGHRFAVSRDSVAFIQERRGAASSALEALKWVAVAVVVLGVLALLAVSEATD